jgi:hypothetical protein
MSYREVDWPPEIAYAAMIAANANGGDWEPTKLREALTFISEDAGATVDSETLGLESDFLEKLFRGQELQLNIQEMEQNLYARQDAKPEKELF